MEYEIIKIQCLKGFQLNGSSLLGCSIYGTWSNQTPICAGMLYCLLLPVCCYEYNILFIKAEYLMCSINRGRNKHN